MVDRYRQATLEEFNLASMGYWRNWERMTGWLARRISYMMITGNPHIEKGRKPGSETELFSLSIDGDAPKRKPRQKKLTQKQIDLFKSMINESLELNSKS